MCALSHSGWYVRMYVVVASRGVAFELRDGGFVELVDAVAVVQARAEAAVRGAGERDVGRDQALLLLTGVAVDAGEALDVITSAALNTIDLLVTLEHDAVSVIRGALVETFVLGALVGPEDGAL